MLIAIQIILLIVILFNSLELKKEQFIQTQLIMALIVIASLAALMATVFWL